MKLIPREKTFWGRFSCSGLQDSDHKCIRTYFNWRALITCSVCFSFARCRGAPSLGHMAQHVILCMRYMCHCLENKNKWNESPATMGVCLLWYFAPIKFGPHTAMIHMFIGWNHRPIRWLEWFGRQTLFILHNTCDFFNYQLKNRQTLFGTLVFFQGLP